MKKCATSLIASLGLCAALALPVVSSAQAQNAKPHHYKLIDLGTFGGPQSSFFSSPIVESVNNRGTVVGGADTGLPDPTCFFDCNILHAFEWTKGVLTDLGTLPGGPSSTAYWVNEQGLVLGGSENGVIDPVFGGPQQIAVIWKDGKILGLGTLGGGVSFGNAMNNQGEVVGITANAIPDPLSLIGVGTQIRAFLWRDGVMLDLGTLGGPDSWGASVNERGQVAGWALVDSTVNSVTGQPTQHPFLWESGRMRDLGTLGGTLAVVGSLNNGGSGASLNNRGQVIGTSYLAGDLIYHPFLWIGGALTDLGTLGGDNGEAYWINDAGEIVGRADMPGSQVHHGFLWKNGKMIDLGDAPGQPCSTASDINSRGQIILNTGICGVGGGPGMLWENGNSYNLNNLIQANSGMVVGDTNYINDRGEIAATGILPNGDEHAILLVPCDQDHRGLEGCDYDLADATLASVLRTAQPTQASAAATTQNRLSPAEVMARFHSMMKVYSYLSPTTGSTRVDPIIALRYE
jgi:probable HAF family extracellular repeat protein